MKFLIDMGVGKKVEEWFKQEGYDVKNVRDLDICLKDADILLLAVSENRIIITMDKDFGELVYNSGMSHSGVLILRLEDLNGNEKVSIVNPKVMVGKPVIRGTRLTAEFILELLAHGSTIQEILNEYKGITGEDIQACLLFAGKSLEGSSFLPLAVELDNENTLKECCSGH